MKYPEIKNPDFYNKIEKIYEDYKIPKKKKSFDEICFPKKYELQIPQMFMSKFINPDTPYKGILLMYSAGSGKSMTAIQVAEEWKLYKRIVVLLPASLRGNFRNELRSNGTGDAYITKEERKKISNLNPLSDDYKEIIDKSNKRIDKYYEIYSYNKFATLSKAGKFNLKNSILIIDEVQNVVSEKGTYYDLLYDEIMRAPNDLRVIIMSATPLVDRVSEIALTLNLLKLPKPLPTGREFEKMFINVKKKNGKNEYTLKNHELFKQYVKGYVSYFRGPPEFTFPEMKIKYIKCEMSNFQLSAYNSILETDMNKELSRESLKNLAIEDLPNNFFIGSRIVSNIVFPNKKINDSGFDSFKGKTITENLEKYSTKFYQIMNRIEKSTGKVFVYSGFREFGGLKSFARVLEEYGYKDYNEHGTGKKTYAIWSGSENAEMKEEIRSVYNNKNNLNGSKIKVLLLSSAAKEGLSLYAVRQCHLLEGYWNMARIIQVVARGSRYCSHKDLEEDKRNIKVYIYMAVHKSLDITIDQYIYELAVKKHKLIRGFEKLLKESAIDCSLFKNANDTEKEKIKCDQ